VSQSIDLLYSTAALYRIPRDTLREMLAEGDLNSFERYICQVEEGIFAGAFSADKVEEFLRLVVFSENLSTKQTQNIEALHNHPMRETFVSIFKNAGFQALAVKIETGEQSRPNAVSLSEKKNFYQEVFDDMGETLTAIKDNLTTMRSSDSRIATLLERIEKCENEIHRIRGIMGQF
jgi:hypothetical protein